MTEALPELAGAVLAAGESRRLGIPKQLLDFHGQPLVRHAVTQALPVCGNGVTVVTGAHADEVRSALRGLQVTVAHNPNWQHGMAGSLASAVAAAGRSDCAGLLLWVCDQPRVTTTHLAALAALWQNDPSRAAAACYADLPGVPAIVPRSWFSRLTSLQSDGPSDRGARALLREDAATQCLDLPEAAIDIDTPDDLTHLGPSSGQL